MRASILMAALMVARAMATPAEDARGVSDRLAQDLVCMCGECDRLTLAACTCPSAVKERKRLVDEVSTLDLSTEKSREQAYRTIRKAYLARFGNGAAVYEPTIPTRWVYFGLLGAMTLAGAVLLVLPRKTVRKRARRRAH